MTAAITVTALHKRHPGFALGPLSFTVPAGGRLAIVGPSGSGKTTLLRCLAGLERADGGRVQIGDVPAIDGARQLPPDRRRLGLVFQDGALWPHMTALQHLTFAAPALRHDAALALLSRAGLQAHAHKRPAQLSGGEAQRLGVLRALAPQPSVLLLDEPLRSVDVHQRDAMVLLLRELADERALTTVLVTHDRDEALALATDLVVLHEGQLVEQGPALALLQAPRCAFTAAFLLGAACLPTETAPGDRVGTPFGALSRPAGSSGDLRLVLFPGDVRAQRAGDGPRGRVLSTLPHGARFRARVAFAEQIVQADVDAPLPSGADVTLSLTAPGRLLPWRPTQHPAAP